MTVILFEDERVAQLHPATLGRPAFSLLCGGYRLLELAARLGQPVRATVRPHLENVLREDAPDLLRVDRIEPPVLLVNARLVPRVGAIRRLQELVAAGQPFTLRSGDALAAELLADDVAADWRRRIALPAGGLQPHDRRVLHEDLPLFDYPHDLVRHHAAALNENLQDRLATGNYREVRDGLFAADDARVGEHVVVDAQHGPVVVDRGASIGPLSFVRGPVYLAPGATVIEQASLRQAVVVGPGARVGGEVTTATFEAFSNKQHAGFLGHSYVGCWVNLGAGTTNSNLKNTYGPIAMRYGDRKVATDMQFLGAIFGDYAKTAIGTMIFTGKTIGAGSVVYGFATGNVPSFVNYAPSFGQTTAGDIDVLLSAQKRMFGRRGVAQRRCDADLLRAMYDLTAAERQGLTIAPLQF